MVAWKSKAWVTSAVTDEEVDQATVLAESIRKTKTKFRIAVITSMKVSSEKRLVLKSCFDIVMFLEGCNAPEKILNGNKKHALAKTYVFDLVQFSKCVFVSSNSLFLENADALFEPNKFKFEACQKANSGGWDTSLLAVEPETGILDKVLCCFDDSGTRQSRNDCLAMWLQNQNTGMILENVQAKFSVTSGKLQSIKTHSPIINFVSGDDDASDNEVELEPRLFQSLQKINSGRQAQLITGAWLKIYEQVAQTMASAIPRDNHYEMDSALHDSIAIVGMSCRYPAANSLQEFWKLLIDGNEAIKEPPSYRWTKEHAIRVNQQDLKSQAGFLSTKVDEFDARFFGLSPKEVTYMDPQTRLLHEVVWESLEDAGINPLSLYGKHTGIYTGSWMNDYKDIVASSAERDFFRTYMGNSIGAAAARLSFMLGSTGPSIATESGCSSAIVALDLAVRSLRSGETNLSIVGGVNLLLHAFNSDMMEYVISPDGRCKTFDAKADGFGRAEGCGVLVLKRLGDAMRDRDNIWAVIRGCAVSQEGLSRSLGTPTVHCEALAMQLALNDAKVSPEMVSFVETHGTGTAVGDPMEVAAITKAYHSPLRTKPLIIGSVKTNVGHTESCSGITGIMKAVLALTHELVPKHRNLETLNPEIFLEGIPAIIPLEHVPWPKTPGLPRICGVSSFGITGTDGHVILQEAPTDKLPKFTLGMERPRHLIKISAKSDEALDSLLSLYETQFSQVSASNNIGTGFANAAYSSNVGRATFNHRAILIAEDYHDAAAKLNAKKYAQGEVTDGCNPEICFLFTGQGSQYAGMAKTLYDTSPIFRVNFDACNQLLEETYHISIKNALWNAKDVKELSRTIYSQTSIFCVEYCLLRLWESWGIKPDYVLGHSLGEFCAAVAAGILSFEDALKLVAERSRLIDSLPRGSMLVINASKPDVNGFLAKSNTDLDIAAINNPEQTVVAGDTPTVEAFKEYLKGQGVKCIILEATHAFHSRRMDPMLEKYRQVAESVAYKEKNPTVQYISGMEGRVIDDVSEIGSDYWVRHTREPVNFVDACVVLRETGCQDFLEVGPQPVLSSFVMMNNEGITQNCVPSLRRNQDDWETILGSLGKLFLLGHPVDWEGYDETYLREKVSLPFHPFYRKSFWVDVSSDNATSLHPLIGHPVKNASGLSIFQNRLVLKSVLYLKDHCIGNRIVFPGAGFTEMCLSAGYLVANGLTDAFEQPTRAMALENVRIETPLELKDGKSCCMQAIVDLPQEDGKADNIERSAGFRVRIFHQAINDVEDVGKWVLHASSTFVPVAATMDCLANWNWEEVSQIINSVEPTSSNDFYKRVEETGLKFGSSFKSITRYWKPRNTEIEQVVAEITLPKDYKSYLLHPLIIDAVFQTGMLNVHKNGDARLRVPVRIGRITVISSIEAVENANDSLYMFVKMENGAFQLYISTCAGTLLARVEDVELLETNVRTIESVLEQQHSPVPDSWEEVWKPISKPVSAIVEEQVDPDPIVKLYEPSPTTDEHVLLRNKTKTLLALYITHSLQELGWKPEIGEKIHDIPAFCAKFGILPAHHQLVRFYLTVLEQETTLLTPEKNSWIVSAIPLDRQTLETEITELYEYLKASKVTIVTSIYKRIADSLPDILKGEKSALALLYPQEDHLQEYSADCFYLQHPGRKDVLMIVRDLLKPVMENIGELIKISSSRVYRILEVGSGTGSMSTTLLELARDNLGKRFEYWFTDISQTFFRKAEGRFAEFSGNIKYSLFNIEQSAISQGIPLEYFDMVACTDVLHATKSLEETLVHLRQTMRPDAMLIFTETIMPATDITFVFGPLQGYWRFQDFSWRQHHCCVGQETWKELLLQCGYRSPTCVPTYTDQLGCLVAVADENYQLDQSLVPKSIVELAECNKWLLFANNDDFLMTTYLANMLTACEYRVSVVLKRERVTLEPSKRNLLNASVNLKYIEGESLEEIRALVSDAQVHGIVFAWSMDILEKDQKQIVLPLMNIAKTLVSLHKSPHLYILVPGVQPVTEDTLVVNPTAATLIGMAKSLKNEHDNAFVRILDVEPNCTPDLVAKQLLYEMTMCKGAKEQLRVQVGYRNGVRYEAKMVKASLQHSQDYLKLPPSTESYRLVLPESRVIQDLTFAPQERLQVGDKQIEVKVKAYALNFRDIFTVLKPSAEFEHLNVVGLDFAGIITRIGSDVMSHQVGDRVYGINFDNHSQLPSHRIVDAETVNRIPEGMTFSEVATLPAVFSTAYHCLVDVAKMKRGETVLIHTGSGGVGLAAINLAKHFGVNIITTAGNARKREYLRNMGIEHVFHSRDTSYEQDIMRVTNGRGVDIVLNSITGPGIKEATLRATAKNGRWIEMSKLSVWTPEQVYDQRPDVKYAIVDLTVLDTSTIIRLNEKLKEYLDAGIQPPIAHVRFDALAIRQAMQYFQMAKHIGKVVVTMPDVDMEQGQFRTKLRLFNSESVYLITGGLGGIGFEVCKWMLSLGATDIVLNGRSPPKAEVQQEIDQLRKQGFHIVVKLGSVGDYQQCKQIVDEIRHECKPLRGIMHCAGVLWDNLYSNQTWECFEATFTPKVTGTWNLHNFTLDFPLEHFVVYSSMAAILGTPGQPNHSAANCFEDSFIHYRHSLGLPGTSINWGQWSQVGCAKDVTLSSFLPVSCKRMLNGLELMLRSPKLQVGFGECESFPTLAVIFPFVKGYLDERLWKQSSNSGQKGHTVNTEQFWKDIDAEEEREGKRGVLVEYLKNILRSALRLEPEDAISDSADLQELGVDSLTMIELKNSMQSMLGSKVSLTSAMLKNCNTLSLLAEAVLGKILNQDEIEQVPLEPLPAHELLGLLRNDMILPEHIGTASETAPAVKVSQVKRVLLTGATGHLGHNILAKLTTDYPGIVKVVCVVRGDAKVALERLKVVIGPLKVNFEKVECVSGDVTEKNLGLSNDLYEKFSLDIDAVIHCAAKLHPGEHLRWNTKAGRRTDCRSVNLDGTLNILSFASTRKVKHVYYPSTLFTGALGKSTGDMLSDCWPEAEDMESLVSNKVPGMQTCKLLGELLMEQANKRGIPCKVFRFPWIAGNRETGKVNPDSLYILRFLGYLKIGAMPMTVLPANFLPVDICAENSLKLFFNEDAPCEVFNLSHPKPQIEQDFVALANQEFQKKIDVLEENEFKERVEQIKDTGVTDQATISEYMSVAAKVVTDYATLPDTFFENRKVSELIRGYGNNFPPTMEILRKDLKYLKDIGVLDKFGITN